MENEQNTKKNLMDIAVKLFAEKGYDSVGVQEICGEAKITKPTLYYYFGSKAGLLQSIIESAGGNLLDRIREAAAYTHDFQNSLTKILKAAISFALANEKYFDLHCSLSNAPDGSEAAAIFSAQKDALESEIQTLFANSCNEFGNMRGKEKLYALLYQNNVRSVAQAVIRGKIGACEETVYQIVHSFMYGIAN